jgi:hypothetical protein
VARAVFQGCIVDPDLGCAIVGKDVAEVSKQWLSRNRLERVRRIDRSQWGRRSSARNEFAKKMSLPKTWIEQDHITLAA